LVSSSVRGRPFLRPGASLRCAPGLVRAPRDLDVSIAADVPYEIVSIVLPYSDTRTVRELLPQLTRLNRTVDQEEAERKRGRLRVERDGRADQASAATGQRSVARTRSASDVGRADRRPKTKPTHEHITRAKI